MPKPKINRGPIKEPSRAPKAALNSSQVSSNNPKPGSPPKSPGKDTVSKGDVSYNESLGNKTPKSGFEESKDYSR